MSDQPKEEKSQEEVTVESTAAETNEARMMRVMGEIQDILQKNKLAIVPIIQVQDVADQPVLSDFMKSMQP